MDLILWHFLPILSRSPPARDLSESESETPVRDFSGAKGPFGNVFGGKVRNHIRRIRMQ